MALDTVGLSGSLFQLFSAPPDSISDCAAAWADAMEDYTKAVIPASTTVSAAAEAFKGLLLFAFTSSNANTSCNTLAIENAFRGFTDIVATGMVGWTATPPVGFIGFCDLPLHTNHGAAALEVTTKIDIWMKTGIAVLQVPPFTTVNWT